MKIKNLGRDAVDHIAARAGIWALNRLYEPNCANDVRDEFPEDDPNETYCLSCDAKRLIDSMQDVLAPDIEKPTINPSSGNVFRDLELPCPEEKKEIARLRSALSFIKSGCDTETDISDLAARKDAFIIASKALSEAD